MMKEFEIVVGLEIHAHVKTDSKMFCRCATGPKGKDYKVSEKDEPNIRNCAVCTGQPGTLPVPNKKAIEDTILLGLALGSKISEKFNFERKNYFYPDLPKAYQITSATNPPVVGGKLEISIPIEYKSPFYPEEEYTLPHDKTIHLEHIHLEEDAGKLTHSKSEDFSLVDLNRAGTPLLEIITKPEISDGVEAMQFMKDLRAILRALNISDADMEKGQMRCDVNVSVRKKGDKELGTKVEVKNLNSFQMVSRAIYYESHRQIEAIKNGEKIIQETRGWDDNRGKTTPQRSKELAHDYRYFPEPDIPPFEVGKGKDLDSEVINDRLPELPKEKRARFVAEYGVSEHDSRILTDNVEVAEYFEKIIESIPTEAEGSAKKRELGKQTASILITEYLAKVEDVEIVSAENFAGLVTLLDKGEISGKIAKEILPEMIEAGKSAEEIMKEKGLKQVSDESEVEKIIDEVLAENSSEVERYKSGQQQLFGFFVGQVMQATKGQANPKIVNDLLRKKL